MKDTTRLAVAIGALAAGAVLVVATPIVVTQDVGPFADDSPTTVDTTPEVLGSQTAPLFTFPEVIVIEIRQGTTTTTSRTTTTAPPVAVPPTTTTVPVPEVPSTTIPVPTTPPTTVPTPPVPAPTPVPEPIPLPEPVDDALGAVLGYIADTPRRGRFGEHVRTITPGRTP